MRVIAVAGMKGGTGKTTIAINLAETLRNDGARVVMVDMDPQSSARYWRDIAEEQGHTSTCAVIGATGPSLGATLRTLEPAADVVVVDTPPRLGPEARAAIAFARVVIAPVAMGGADVWALEQTAAAIKEAAAVRTDGGPRVWAVLNRIDPRTAFARTLPDAVKEQGFIPAKTAITNRVAWAEALAVGQSIVTYAPESPAMAELRALLEEVKP